MFGTAGTFVTVVVLVLVAVAVAVAVGPVLRFGLVAVPAESEGLGEADALLDGDGDCEGFVDVGEGEGDEEDVVGDGDGEDVVVEGSVTVIVLESVAVLAAVLGLDVAVAEKRTLPVLGTVTLAVSARWAAVSLVSSQPPLILMAFVHALLTVRASPAEL